MDGFAHNLKDNDDQAEKQWSQVNDKEWLKAEKLGYKTKQEYQKAKLRLTRIENLIANGATRAQAIKEVNCQEQIEAKQEAIDKARLDEENKRKRNEFIQRYLKDFNDIMR